MELNAEAHKVVTDIMTDATTILSHRNYEMKTVVTSTTISTTQAAMVGTSAEDEVESGFIVKPEDSLATQLPHLKAKDPVEIRFENIGYTVRVGFTDDAQERNNNLKDVEHLLEHEHQVRNNNWNDGNQFKRRNICIGKKKVLHEVCGKFPPNKLIAIMGPSGAGKSTLLDLISGYRTGGLEGTGKVIINDKLRILEDFRRVSCYIQQDDRIQPLLTVQENMSLAADLKLGPRVCRKEKQNLIDEILSVLNLTETKKTRGARLSGGQKKRLSIALELINNPSVMFLDEPTTGLDSSSCSQCISLLRQLAHQGRTIICTIHQPSASLLQMFDQLYILSAGKCLYQGTTDNMIRYLKTQHIPCPLYHNPADFIIEVACGEYGEDKIQNLVNGINNGKSLQWFRNSRTLFDAEFLPDEVEIKRRKKELKKKNKQMVPMYYQLAVLLKRGFIKLQRDQTLTHLRITVNFFVSVMLGLIYVNSGDDATRIFDNYNLIFALIMHHVMSAMMINIISFPMEMNIVLKEHFNRWYSLKMYFLAHTVLDIPIATFSTVMFDTIVYCMSNQLFEWYRFFFFTLTSLSLVFVAQSIGYAFGTVFSVVNGTFAGPIFLVPMMMFSGFGVNLRDIPSYLEWGTHVSFFRYGLEVMVESVYGFSRKSFSCYVTYCHYKYPETFLQAIAMENVNVEFSLSMLGATIVLMKIVSYYVLWWKVRYGR